MEGRASAHRYLLSAAARLSPPDVDPQRSHGVGGARCAVVKMNAVGPRRQRRDGHQHAPIRLSKAHHSLYRTQPCAEGRAGDTETACGDTAAAAPGGALGDPGWGGGWRAQPCLVCRCTFPTCCSIFTANTPQGTDPGFTSGRQGALGLPWGSPAPDTGAAAYQRWFPFAPFSTTMRRSIMLRTNNVESTRSGS